MPQPSKRLVARFYVSESGKEPVRDWLKDLSKEDRRKIGEDIKTVEYGFPIGMPICRPMGNGLYEVRTNLDHQIARILFCVKGQEMVLLHGFIKKSQKTPKPDLELAQRRKAKVTGEKN
jgi:phage-related protein